MKASTERPPITLPELLRSAVGDRSRFPASLLERTEHRYAFEFPSGRAALSYALRNEGIGGTDEVLVPAFTDSAVDRVVDSVATSVNVDISPETFNLDLGEAEELITDRTAAIVPTHMYGQPMDMEAISAFADEHNLTVIEDAAHALGSIYLGEKVGTESDYAMFSFRFSKDATVFTGGLLLARDRPTTIAYRPPDRLSLAKLGGVIVLLSLLDRLPGDMYYALREYLLDPYFRWSAGVIGELDPRRLSAAERATLDYQYRTIPERIATRREHAARYDEGLPASLSSPTPTDDHAYWRYTLLVPPTTRDRICRSLQRRGIGCSTTYAYVVSPPGLCPRAEDAAKSVLNLPVHSGLTGERIDDIVETVTTVWDGIPESVRDETPSHQT